MKKYTFYCFITCLAIFFSCYTNAQDFKPLFNGKDLSGWYSFLKNKGKNNDSNQVFTVNNGLLHITGQDFGYIITERSFTDFHLVVEFKWGGRKNILPGKMLSGIMAFVIM